MTPRKGSLWLHVSLLFLARHDKLTFPLAVVSGMQESGEEALIIPFLSGHRAHPSWAPSAQAVASDPLRKEAEQLCFALIGALQAATMPDFPFSLRLPACSQHLASLPGKHCQNTHNRVLPQNSLQMNSGIKHICIAVRPSPLCLLNLCLPQWL